MESGRIVKEYREIKMVFWRWLRHRFCLLSICRGQIHQCHQQTKQEDSHHREDMLFEVAYLVRHYNLLLPNYRSEEMKQQI